MELSSSYKSPGASVRLQTVEELAGLWRITPYTLREWAREHRIVGASQKGRQWRFEYGARLRVPTILAVTVNGGASGHEQLVDLADYPLTPVALASRWCFTQATIRRWACAGAIQPAVFLPCGWRFSEASDMPAFAKSDAGPTPNGPADCRPSEDLALAAMKAMKFGAVTEAPAARLPAKATDRDAPDGHAVPSEASPVAEPREQAGSELSYSTVEMPPAKPSRPLRRGPDLRVTRHIRSCWPSQRKKRAAGGRQGRHETTADPSE